MKNKMNSVYKQAERFAEITNKAIISGNILRAKRFLSIADQLLENGSTETKSVISKVYVSSVFSFMELLHCNISNLFPSRLKTEYAKQINNTTNLKLI